MKAYLKMQLFKVLFPIVRPVNTCAPIRPVQSHTLCTIQTPPSHIQLPGTFIRENDTYRAEDVRLDVHSSPGVFEIVSEGQVEFVCTRGVVEFTCSEFLDHGDFVVCSESDDEWDYHASDQEL